MPRDPEATHSLQCVAGPVGPEPGTAVWVKGKVKPSSETPGRIAGFREVLSCPLRCGLGQPSQAQVLLSSDGEITRLPDVHLTPFRMSQHRKARLG